MDIKGKILHDIFHFNRLNQAYLRTANGSVNTLVDQKQITILAMRINGKTELNEHCVIEVVSKYFLVF